MKPKEKKLTDDEGKSDQERADTVIHEPIFTSYVPSDEELRSITSDVSSDEDEPRAQKKKTMPEYPREPELQDQIFKGKDGKPLEGQYFQVIPEEEVDLHNITGITAIEYSYVNGKIHGEKAIIYPDGLEETWENGKFVKIRRPPYKDR